MEPEGSLPHSQVPTTYSYPEPARSSLYPHIPLPEDPFMLLTFHISFSLLRSYQNIKPVSWQVFMIRNKASFYCEVLSTLLPTPKPEDHFLSAVRDCLFNTFAATLLIGGCSSFRNLRTRHAVVTGTHLSRVVWLKPIAK